MANQVWRKTRLATMTGAGLGVVGAGIVAAADGTMIYAGPLRKHRTSKRTSRATAMVAGSGRPSGKACDLAIRSIEDHAAPIYRNGDNPLHTRIRNRR